MVNLAGLVFRNGAGRIRLVSAPLDLRLAEGTPAEAYERLSKALDDGLVSPQAFDALTRSLERRLRILDAEKYRQRLEEVEAAARLAASRTAMLGPAGKMTLDVTRGAP